MSVRLSALALAALLTASPAAAQYATLEIAGLDPVLQESLETCYALLTRTKAATIGLPADGWRMDEPAPTRFFYSEVYADKTISGVGEAYLFLGVERYPGTSIAYCSFDITLSESIVEIAGFAEAMAGAGISYSASPDGTELAWTDTGIHGHLRSNAENYFFQVTFVQGN